jgi:hypothetical protein
MGNRSESMDVTMCRRVLCICLFLVAMVGCDRRVIVNETSSKLSWSKSGKAGSIAGLDWATVNRSRFGRKDGGTVVVVVWTDLEPDGLSVGSAGSGEPGVYFVGFELKTGGPRPFAYDVTFRDNKPGSIHFDSVRFSLDRGTLFLVSTKTTPPAVKQLEFDPSGTPLTEKAFLDLAAANPGIRQFFTDAHHK